jgi:hypothetical protein
MCKSPVFCACRRIRSFLYYKTAFGYFSGFWNTDIIATVDPVDFVKNAEKIRQSERGRNGDPYARQQSPGEDPGQAAGREEEQMDQG